MRSQTSRGVPEWSGGKDLYIWEVLFWSPEKFRALSVLYRECRKGSGGPPRGSTCPGATWAVGVCALAYMGQGHQPQEAHAPRDKKKGRVLKGEGTSEVPWGRMDSSLAAPFLGGRAKAAPPLSLGPIYSGGREGSNT